MRFKHNEYCMISIISCSLPDALPRSAGSAPQFGRSWLDFGSMLGPFGSPFGSLLAPFLGNVCAVIFYVGILLNCWCRLESQGGEGVTTLAGHPWAPFNVEIAREEMTTQSLSSLSGLDEKTPVSHATTPVSHQSRHNSDCGVFPPTCKAPENCTDK